MDTVFTLVVTIPGADTETATFEDKSTAEQAAVAAVDPYETGEYERALGQAGAVVFITPDGAEDEAEARITESRLG